MVQECVTLLLPALEKTAHKVLVWRLSFLKPEIFRGLELRGSRGKSSCSQESFPLWDEGDLGPLTGTGSLVPPA